MSEEKKGGIKRRDFLKIIGVAGGTAAVASSCSEPVEQIIPYVIPPEGIIPGVPNYYASTCRECSAGCGIKIKNREGRAIFIEGNEDNPVNKGSVCSMGQASLQGLYNPDRTRSPLSNINNEKLSPLGWEAAEKALTQKIEEARANGKTGNIAFLSSNITGTLGDLVDDWMDALGGKHLQYETFAHEPLKEANKLSFGIDAIPTYKIQNAKYLLSFGADFVETWLSPTEYTREFAEMHTFKDKSIGRFIHIEPRASLTATNADDWISIKPGTEGVLALGIANEIVTSGKSANGGGGLRGLLSKYPKNKVSEITTVPEEVIVQLAEEFATMGPSLAIGGGTAVTGTNATETSVAINILNYVAGNIGDTIDFGDTLSISTADSFQDVQSLVDSMDKGEIDILFIYDVNPVFTLPTQLNFKDALGKVPFIVSFSSFMDETTEHANLIMPNNTNIESWGDYFPRESVQGLIQPAMSPVFNTKGTGDVILSVSGQVEELNGRYEQTTFYDYLRNSWKKIWTQDSGSSDFETFWKEALENGGIYKDLPSKQVALSPSVASLEFPEAEFIGEGEFYFMAYPSYIFHDGRGANKPWLQELPEAITTGVWSSWVEVHPDTAKKLGVDLGDYLSIESPQGVIETQVYVYQGARPDTLSVMIGQGHTSYGRYAKDRGVNPITILPLATDSLSGGFAWLSTKVNAAKVNKSEQFVQIQYSTEQHDRDIAQDVSLAALLEGKVPDDGHHGDHHADFYPPREYHKYRWGMAIDLQKCTGCGSCITACAAENNIPFVGKQLCAQRRDMAWMRIERYFEKSNNNAGFSTRYLPMLCQQCGNAPCEPVCPVFATYHNPEGLNGMIYNRCVGTRYCANNCTYKVRKFNFFTYKWPEPLNWQLNPDVTVRSKGVMEKCTFCVQRINHAKDLAKDVDRDVQDGEFKVACEMACATGAITFGNLEDHDSKVYKESHDKRGYKVLAAVNTQPGITYLKKITQDEESKGSESHGMKNHE